MSIKKQFDLEFLEKKIISQKNRFKLDKEENKEIKKIFANKTVLIIGASGSIGSKFSLDLINHKFKKLYLLDKMKTNLLHSIDQLLKKV